MARKHQGDRGRAPGIKGPSPLVYGLALTLDRFLLKLLYRVRYRKDPKLASGEEPYFIIGNHVAFIDPLICAAALPDQRIRFVTGQEIAGWRLLRGLLRKLGIIEIQPFRVNFSTTKEIIQSIANRCSVALYPETQRSVAGDLTPFGTATAKLVKHLKVPVVGVICRGGYLSWPRWARKPRLGKLEVETRLLLTAQEAESLSVDEIHGRLVEAVAVDDYAWQRGRSKPARFHSGRRAEKMSYVCHWCPVCDRPLVMRSQGRKLFCSLCELSLRVDATGFFSASPGSPAPFDDPLALAGWQRQRLTRSLEAGDRLESSCRLVFWENLGQGPDPDPGERVGRLVLCAEGLAFIDEDERPALHFEIETTPSLYCDLGRYVNLPDGEIIWRAYPEEEGYVALLTDYCRQVWTRDNHFERYLP